MVVVFGCCLGDRGVMINEGRATCVMRCGASGGKHTLGVPDRNNWVGFMAALWKKEQEGSQGRLVLQFLISEAACAMETRVTTVKEHSTSVSYQRRDSNSGLARSEWSTPGRIGWNVLWQAPAAVSTETVLPSRVAGPRGDGDPGCKRDASSMQFVLCTGSWPRGAKIPRGWIHAALRGRLHLLD
jgi:hypothetical protein